MPFYGACYKHDDREAKRKCFRCKEPICPECQSKEHGHIFCDGGCASKHEKEQYLKRLDDNRRLDKVYGIDPSEKLKMERPKKRENPKKKNKEKPKRITVDLSDNGVKSAPTKIFVGSPLETPPRPVARAVYPRPQPKVQPQPPTPTRAQRSSPALVTFLATIILLQGIGIFFLGKEHNRMMGEIARLTAESVSGAVSIAPPKPPPTEEPDAQPEWVFRWLNQESYVPGLHWLPVSITLNGETPPRAAARLIVDGWAGEWRDLQRGQTQFRFDAQPGQHTLKIELLSDGLPVVFSPVAPIGVVEPEAVEKTVAKENAPRPVANERELKHEPEIPLPLIDIDRGLPTRPQLSLTFDGGSENNISEEVLDILKEKGIKTTLFLTAQFIKKFPKTTRRIVADGHEVGNHCYNHPHLTTWAQNRIHRTLPNVNRKMLTDQLTRTADLFKKITGKDMAPLWRAPYGEANSEILGWARDLGWRHVAWTTNREKKLSLDSHDWIVDRTNKLYKTAEEIKEHLLTFAQMDQNGLGGGIILMHLGTQRKIDQAHTMLESLIDEVRDQGYRFTKVSVLMKEM